MKESHNNTKQERFFFFNKSVLPPKSSCVHFLCKQRYGPGVPFFARSLSEQLFFLGWIYGRQYSAGADSAGSVWKSNCYCAWQFRVQVYASTLSQCTARCSFGKLENCTLLPNLGKGNKYLSVFKILFAQKWE